MLRALALLLLAPSSGGLRPTPPHFDRRGFLRTTPGAIASGGFAGTARAATATASSDGSAVLDPTKWPLDQSQWTQYRARRAVIFDTRAQSFLPANPERLLAAALRKRSEQTEAAASASAGYTSTHGGGSGGDAR